MRIGGRGQVTIPKHIRDQFGLKPKTEVQFRVINGNIVLRKTPRKLNLAKWKGYCGKPSPSSANSTVDARSWMMYVPLIPTEEEVEHVAFPPRQRVVARVLVCEPARAGVHENHFENSAKTAEQTRRRALETGFNNLEDAREERVRTIREIAEDYLASYRLRDPQHSPNRRSAM